ncbi:MAG TPA: GspMb/PilO family protein [Terriglobia bacterium]|nr:GspMb/PilO family protein [Terriglobia bacterium]
MRRERRKKIFRIFETAALAVLAIDLAVYFAVVRPQRARALRAEESYHQTFLRFQLDKLNVARLEKFHAELPAANVKLKDYLNDHVPSRQRVFSDALQLVTALTEKSGVQLDNVSYKLSSAKGEPFDQLGLDVSVEGPYSNLLNFAHSLETSDDLILVRNFSFAAGQGSTVNLRVGGVLYLTP